MTNAPASNVWSILANATVSSTMDTSTMSAMTVSTPTPTAPSTVNTVTAPAPGVLVAAVLSGAFLAALVTAAINIWLTRRKSREEERNRVRTSFADAFADAFAAYSAYKEFPYAIRRRRADTPGEERIRLSEALREIQANLAYHLAWTAAESETVGNAYANLVQHVRRTAGSAMHEAWKSPPADSDDTMNIPPTVVDLSSLAPHEAAYMEVVREHLRRLAPWWAR
jgi:multidrug efflux pump subunit AcrB